MLRSLTLVSGRRNDFDFEVEISVSSPTQPTLYPAYPGPGLPCKRPGTKTTKGLTTTRLTTRKVLSLDPGHSAASTGLECISVQRLGVELYWAGLVWLQVT